MAVNAPYTQLTADVIKGMIGDRQNMRFVHLQKTGGHSVKQIEHPCIRFESTNHDRMTPIVGNPVEYSHIRNPYDWLVSVYFHGNGLGIGDIGSCYSTFKDFIMDVHRPVSHVKSRYLNRENRRPLCYLQAWQSFERKRNGLAYACVEFYIRFEKMTQAYHDIWGIELTHQNKSAKRKKDYKEYYDDEMLELVKLYRGQELRLLGYDFNGALDDAIAIKVNEPYNMHAVKHGG